METTVTVGSLLSTGLAIFIKRLPYLIVLSAVIYLPQIVVTYWAGNHPTQVYWALFTFPLLLLGSFVSQGAITVAAYRDLRGQGFQLGAGLSRAMSRILPLLGLAIATAVMVSLGYVLLIVPGIMLQCAIFVAVPALMVEDVGIGGAISRSFDLTAGYRLKIFGLVLLTSVIVMVPVFIVGLVVGMAGGGDSLVYQIFNSLISGIAGSASSVAAVVTYYRLREDVDGVGLEQLDEVFA